MAKMTEEERKKRIIDNVNKWRLENPERWKIYNRNKQKEYRRNRGLKRESRLTTEQIFGSEGHCPRCGMRLEAEFHIKFPCRK